MLKNQRHLEILEILEAERFVGVADLSRRLYASQPTIRRDLDILEKQGYLRRSHGGAVLADEGHPPISFRSGTHTKEKQGICRAAATLVPPSSFLFIDASTTALPLAGMLRPQDNVRILTNGLHTVKSFSEKGHQIYSTGGRLLSDSLAFVGDTAMATVERYSADLMFFSSSSLDDTGMISDYSEEETALRLCMAKCARKKVFLCDSAKFGTTSVFRLFPLSEVDYVVTAVPLDETIVASNRLTLRRLQNACLYCRE